MHMPIEKLSDAEFDRIIKSLLDAQAAYARSSLAAIISANQIAAALRIPKTFWVCRWLTHQKMMFVIVFLNTTFIN
jgi:hypothetical protein